MARTMRGEEVECVDVSVEDGEFAYRFDTVEQVAIDMAAATS